MQASGGEVPCITAPTDGIKESRQRMPRAPSLLSDVEGWPCSQLAPRRTRDNADSEAATHGKRKTTDRPLQINPMFPFSSSDRKFLSEDCQPGSTEQCRR